MLVNVGYPQHSLAVARVDAAAYMFKRSHRPSLLIQAKLKLGCCNHSCHTFELGSMCSEWLKCMKISRLIRFVVSNLSIGSNARRKRSVSLIYIPLLLVCLAFLILDSIDPPCQCPGVIDQYDMFSSFARRSATIATLSRNFSLKAPHIMNTTRYIQVSFRTSHGFAVFTT